LVTGDFCCNPLSLGRIKTIIEESVPGIYVNSLKIGSSIAEVSILSVIWAVKVAKTLSLRNLLLCTQRYDFCGLCRIWSSARLGG